MVEHERWAILEEYRGLRRFTDMRAEMLADLARRTATRDRAARLLHRAEARLAGALAEAGGADTPGVRRAREAVAENERLLAEAGELLQSTRCDRDRLRVWVAEALCWRRDHADTLGALSDDQARALREGGALLDVVELRPPPEGHAPEGRAPGGPVE